MVPTLPTQVHAASVQMEQQASSSDSSEDNNDPVHAASIQMEHQASSSDSSDIGSNVLPNPETSEEDNFQIDPLWFDEVAEEPENEYEKQLHSLSKAWLNVELSHNISKIASNTLWDLALSFVQPLMDAKEQEGVTKKIPKFQQLRKKLYQKYAPKILSLIHI